MKQSSLLVFLIFFAFNTYAQKNTEDTTIYTTVAEMPEFAGGDSEMYKFIVNNFHYSDNNSFVTKVYFRFVVEKDGSLSNKQIIINDNNLLLRTGNEDIKQCKKTWCDISLSVLNKMPKWKAGKQNGVNVRVSYTIPITFDPQPDMWKK